MKISAGINQQSYPVGVSDQKPGRAATEKSENVASNAASSASQVSLSPASQITSAASASRVKDTGPFDAKKVEQIKAAIANGQFQVNPGKIADSLISSVQGLLGANA